MVAGLPSAGSTVKTSNKILGKLCADAEQGPLVTNLSIVFGILTIFVLAARLWARIVVVKAVGPDDGAL